MDKEAGLKILRETLQSRGVSRSYIAESLRIHPSQVSRIAAGHFKKMEGNALRVCKFALTMQTHTNEDSLTDSITFELNQKVAQIVSINPEAARALTNMLSAIIDQWITDSEKARNNLSR